MIAIQDGVLHPGDNKLRIEAPGDTGVAADITLLDRAEIAYPRAAALEHDRLWIEGPGMDLTPSGSSGPVTVFDVTEPGAVTRSTVPESHAFHAAKGRRYLAVGPGGYLTPAEIAPAALQPDLRDPTLAADYLAVGPADLLEPLAPLLDRRASQGLRVLAVPLQAVYDQFNHGRAEPEAVRRFLQHAADRWPDPPRFLLLVGDATHDPRGFVTGPEDNRLPSYFVQTEHGGQTVSDARFAQLDDDLKPDLAVGRLPASTPAGVTTIVAKIAAYEDGPPRPGGRRVLALADGQSPDFRADAESFLASFSGGYEPVLLAPETGATGVADQIAGELAGGALILSYFGHGSITQLGKDTLFDVEDGAALENAKAGGRLPVMVNITCLAGLFTHPERESLAEVMLGNPDGGAIAVLAATSLTVPADQAHLSRALVEALLAHPERTLGEIVLAAQRALPVETRGQRAVLETFLLFGDPASRLEK